MRSTWAVAAIISAMVTGLITLSSALSIRFELDGFGSPADSGPRWDYIAVQALLPLAALTATVILIRRANLEFIPLVPVVIVTNLVLAALVIGIGH